MSHRFEDESYSMPLKNGHDFRLLGIANSAGWEKEHEHGNSSLVLTERKF